MRHYCGRNLQVLAVVFSLFVLTGACIAYHILMQECIYKVIYACAQYVLGGEHLDGFLEVWTPEAAAIIILLLFPVANMRHMSTLVRFNSYGVFFVFYTILFIISQGVSKIIHHEVETKVVNWVASESFGILGGIVTLSFFIHNAIQPMVQNSRPENRESDIKWAYFLVGCSYALVGIFGYIGAPHLPNLEQNFLDSFPITCVCVFPICLCRWIRN